MGTHFYDSEGKEIKDLRVRSFKVEQIAGDGPVVTLEILPAKLDITSMKDVAVTYVSLEPVTVG